MQLSSLGFADEQNVNIGRVRHDVTSKLLSSEDISLQSLPIILRYLHSPGYLFDDPISLDNNLNSNIMTLAYHIHPTIDLQTNRRDYTNRENTLLKTLWCTVQTYTLNCISTFVGRCFDERWKFNKKMTESKTDHQTDRLTKL